MASNPSEICTQMQPTTIAVVALELRERIIDITERIFRVPVVVKTKRDPEFPEFESTVFVVEPAGDLQRLIELECEWIRQVAAVLPGQTTFRLAIHPHQ